MKTVDNKSVKEARFERTVWRYKAPHKVAIHDIFNPEHFKNIKGICIGDKIEVVTFDAYVELLVVAVRGENSGERRVYVRPICVIPLRCWGGE